MEMKKAEEMMELLTCPECLKVNQQLPNGNLPKFCGFCGTNMQAHWQKTHRRKVAVCANTACRGFEWDPKLMGPFPEGMKFCPNCRGKLYSTDKDPEDDPWSTRTKSGIPTVFATHIDLNVECA